MRVVLQRVSRARVSVDDQIVGQIDKGILLIAAVMQHDTIEDLRDMVGKILNLRIFSDQDGKMNLSVLDISGDILVVSQFTLAGDCRKGRRPSYSDAARPEEAAVLYKTFVESLAQAASHLKVEQGVFQAHMHVDLVNDGPVTLLLDSKKIF